MNKKLFLGLLISAIAIGILLYQFDIREFKTLQDKWNPIYILPMIFSNLWAMGLFATRWYFLLEKRLSFQKSLLVSFLGVGANMVLPARGGDILRIYYCKTQSDQISYPYVVSKLFIEKVIDLTIVLFIGAISFMLLGLGEGKSRPEAMFLSGIVVLGLILGLILVRFANSFLINMGSKLLSLIKKEELFQTKLAPHIKDLGEFLTFKKLAIPLMISVPTWTLGYAITYLLQSHLIGIHLGYTETLFIVFCGAMGVALPSAPSGVGVFHASIISGFLLLGLGTQNGFLYATAVHLMQFFVLSGCALIAYLMWMGGFQGIKKQASLTEDLVEEKKSFGSEKG
ncbi:MAG: flippase-like domain-containing protein [Leptospira sp.]|nr:flippase-like domain-containing protein [Leptospira sp.]